MKQLSKPTLIVTGLLLIAASAGGCARPQTFADSGLYQPPVVSTGPPSASDPYSSNSNYAPPGQSYNYGAQGNPQYAPTYAAPSPAESAEMQSMYDRLYGQDSESANPPTMSAPNNTIPPANNPPTTYPGGSSERQGVTTNRPATGQGNAANPSSLLRNGGHARPMVPIQRNTSPANPGANATDGVSRSTSLQGDPPTTTDPMRTAPVINAPAPLADSAASPAPAASNDSTSTPPANSDSHPPSGATPGVSNWPYSMAPGGNYPRRQVPLGNSASGAANNAPSGPAMIPPAGSSSPAGGGNDNQAGAGQPVTAFPTGGRWPQKPIPLPREDR